MSAPGAEPESTSADRQGAPEESLLRGGVKGFALVTLATAALAGAAALIAAIVALLF